MHQQLGAYLQPQSWHAIQTAPLDLHSQDTFGAPQQLIMVATTPGGSRIACRTLCRGACHKTCRSPPRLRRLRYLRAHCPPTPRRHCMLPLAPSSAFPTRRAWDLGRYHSSRLSGYPSCGFASPASSTLPCPRRIPFSMSSTSRRFAQEAVLRRSRTICWCHSNRSWRRQNL